MLPRNNAPYLVGLLVIVIAFFAVAAPTGNVFLGLIMGLGLGMAVVLIVHGLFPSSPELDMYRLDARRRVKKVLDSIERIKKLAKQISAGSEARLALENGCKTILDLMHLVQEKNSGNIALTAAVINNYLLDVERVVTQYLAVMEQPNYFDNAPKLIERGQGACITFQTFALSRVREVNQGNLIDYQNALDNIEPLPQLGQGGAA